MALMTSRTSGMGWLEWRRRTERCLMSKIHEMVQDSPNETKGSHLAFRTFHRLTIIADLLQPIAETCDGAGLEFLSHFQLVLNHVSTHLEFCFIQACVDRNSGLLDMLHDHADSFSDFQLGITDDRISL